MKTKNIYQFRGWEGIDVCKATSLYEHGFLFNPNAKKDHCNILRGVGIDKEGNYNAFAYSSINWNDILLANWIDWNDVYSFAGTSEENYKTFSVHALSDLVSMYGMEEIFGSCYHEGFKVNGLD